MKLIANTLLFLLIALTGINSYGQKKEGFQTKTLYTTEELVVVQISPNTFKHISFLQTNDFGKMSCNGLIVRDGNEVIIFDTPADDIGAEKLIKWIKERLNCSIKAIIPTHFHNDSLGALGTFHKNNIPSYASFKTIELAKKNNYAVPQNGFGDSLSLTVGKERVTAKFWGEGHTHDNVVGYFAAENVLFGGCLIKELKANKGYLGDANVAEWSATVKKVKEGYPDVRIIVPGHGAHGNKKLLDYTIKLFGVR